jgi:hypothetical protein
MSKQKKKFKETKIGSFLLEKAPAFFAKVADDSLVGNVIEALIDKSPLPQEDKTVALAKLEIERAEIDGVTRRWMADSRSQSALARNIRPAVLLILVIAYVIGWFYGLETGDTSDLLVWVLSGYFGARSVDKLGIKLNK